MPQDGWAARSRDNLRRVPGTVFVVNPASAAGRTGRQWSAISERLSAGGVEHETCLTSRPLEAIDLTAEALRGGADTVVAVGGDGTVNEVANGFFREGLPRPEAALGVLPLGTGGDFVKTLQIPAEVDAAIAMVKARKLRPLDVGKIEMTGLDGKPYTRYFVNIADAGIGGVVVERVNRTTKLFGGRTSFLYASLATLWTYKPQEMEVRSAEDEFSGRAQNVVLANCRYFGGGMFVAPKAEPDDGKLEVVVFGDIARMEAIRSIGTIYKAEHLKNPKVRAWRSAKVEVSSPERVLIDVDGEMCGTLPATFSVLSKALPVIVP
jgi:YegS/Rv2252/BmrU family lipid kinase